MSGIDLYICTIGLSILLQPHMLTDPGNECRNWDLIPRNSLSGFAGQCEGGVRFKISTTLKSSCSADATGPVWPAANTASGGERVIDNSGFGLGEYKGDLLKSLQIGLASDFTQ